MSAFKLNIDEDLLLIRTSPSLLNYLALFKHWSYNLELPTNRIARVEVTRRAGISTLLVVKKSRDGSEKNFVVSLAKASKKQRNFLTHALPKIISENLSMPEIKALKKEYLD